MSSTKIWSREEALEIIAERSAILDSLDMLYEQATYSLMYHDLQDKLNKPYLKLVPNEKDD